MPEYRIYLIGPDKHISHRVELICTDDQTAKEKAEQLVDGLEVELWEGTRLNKTFPSED